MTEMDLQDAAIGDIADLAFHAAGPQEVELGKYYTIAVGGNLHQLDLTGDQHRAQPRRKTGTTTVRDVQSFVAHWDKHHLDGTSEIYASRDRLTITAVFDAHGDVTPGWGQHRLVLQLEHTTAYRAWLGNSGKEMGQEEFANFLEDNRADIQSPPAAEMLEVAQSIQATTSVDFQSGHRLSDGQRRIAFVETNAAKAGTKGELAIPAEISLGLFVFKGATVADAFTARFRHRINGGNLRLSYRLDRPDDVVDSAFEGVITDVIDETNATVMRGTPA